MWSPAWQNSSTTRCARCRCRPGCHRTSDIRHISHASDSLCGEPGEAEAPRSRGAEAAPRRVQPHLGRRNPPLEAAPPELLVVSDPGPGGPGRAPDAPSRTALAGPTVLPKPSRDPCLAIGPFPLFSFGHKRPTVIAESIEIFATTPLRAASGQRVGVSV